MTQLTRQSQSALALEASAARGLLADLAELTKLRITLLVVVTCWLGYALGQHAAGITPPWWQWLSALAGTALSCMGAGVLNQLREIDTDARMERTGNRPLPAGRIRPATALCFGIALATAGVLLLLVFTHWLAAALSAATVLSYVFIYTPMKRTTSLAAIVGAVPGALPPVIGYAAATGAIGGVAWSIFAIMFLWQLPHFLAIAWLYREDFARAGFPLLPVLDPTGSSTFRQILLTTLALLPLSLLPTILGQTGRLYFTIALLAGAALLALGLRLAVTGRRADARYLFFATLVYLPALLVFFLLDVK